ncbi:MAG TPA: TldD/PmbA family protein [Thermohalobaculum sp.]|nr:TldD/PmbA family protein [Thermohalobaculum sp.]
MTGDDLDVAGRVLERAHAAGAEAVDVLVASGVSSAVGVAGRALEEAERAEGRDLGLRVLVGRRQACVATSDDRDSAIREMAERAVAMARAAPEDRWCGLAEPRQLGAVPDVAALELDDRAEFPEPAALEARARAAEDAALAVAGVTQVEQASASWTRDRITIVQSNGFSGSYARSGIGVACSAIAGEGPGRERDHAYEMRRHLDDLPDAEDIGRRAGQRAAERLHPRRPPAGRCPVLYDERVAASLIGHVLSAINGAAVARGASWLAESMERQILPQGFDIVDDPLIPRGRASRPFDAEGLPAARLALIEDGVLRHWLLDLATARQLGLSGTARARRGVGGPPSPGPSNVRVTEGAADRAALIREMGTGLLVTSMIGSSINPTTGAYSRGASGFWVEGGEIAYPVNEVTVAGSLPEMIRSLRPANDADPAKAVSVPSLLVEGATVGA